MTFAAGANTGTATLLIRGDNKVEADETFTITLGSPTGSGVIGSTHATAIVTILNDDSPPAYAFSNPTYSTPEGDTTGFTTNATVRVSRTGDTTAAGTVTLNLTNGTATGGGTASAGVDYNNTSIVVNFAAGASTGTDTLLIRGDNKVEADETFTNTLGSPTGTGVIGTTYATALVTILNEDRPPENAFSIEVRDLLHVARAERLSFEEIHRCDI